ncbi:MAG: purine-binding chemotaxis protein CheW [Firmicutes bacterium]|nr:purine-binding chemotaxis protein CheW [Bacillota bacterium]
MNDRTGVKESELQLVVFTIEGQEFALHIASVREIIHISKLVVLPDTPLAMVGIINVRGTVLPIIDLGRRFSLKQKTEQDFAAQKVLLVEMEDSMIGYLVDNVSEVLQVPGSSLNPFQKLSGSDSGFIDSICNLEGRLIPVIDSDKLLTGKETEQLESLAKEEI